MKDRRKGFCFQTVEAMDVIRGAWHGEELASAIAVYQAMTDLANRRYREGGREGFRAPRSEIARFAGVGVRTLDKYVTGLERLGLLAVHRERRDDGLHLPNEWTLEDPTGSAAVAPPPVQSEPYGGALTAPPVAQPSRDGSAARSTRSEEVQLEEEEAPQPPQAGERPTAPGGDRKRDQQRYVAQLEAWAPHPAEPDRDAVGAWDGAAEILRSRVTEATWLHYLAPLHPHRLDGDTLVLAGPAQSVAWVEQRYGRMLAHLLGRDVDFVPCSHTAEAVA